MATPPINRIEVVLKATRTEPLHLWVQSTAPLARRFDYGEQESRKILGGLAIFGVLAAYLFPAATVMLLLLRLIVILPLALVGMAGFSRG